MKCRWYTFPSCAVEIEALRAHILKNQFGEQTMTGYVPLELKKRSLCAQFVERLTITYDTFSASTGETKLEEQVTNVTRFVVSQTPICLEVEPGPYGATSLLRDLSRANNNRFNITPIGIDILWLLKQMRASQLDPQLRELRISEVTLSTSTQASVTIRGGDVLSAMRDIMKSRSGRVTSCRLVEISGLHCICSISCLGRCTVEGPNSNQVVEIIREIIAEKEIREPSNTVNN